MGEYVSALDTMYSEQAALCYVKELISKGQEEVFLSTPLLGTGKTTWYTRVAIAIAQLKMLEAEEEHKHD